MTIRRLFRHDSQSMSYGKRVVSQALSALTRAGALVIWPERAMGFGNPNLLSAPEFAGGLTDLSTRAGLVTLSSLAGYDNALAFGHDGSTTQVAYKTYTITSGLAYTLSVVVKMDDGLPPTFVGDNNSATNTFAFVISGQAVGIPPSTYVFVAQPDGTYRVSATFTGTAINANTGIVKYATNNNRTFKVTGYKLEQGSTATTYTSQAQLRELGIYQDSAGTTPVTALADLIGLMTDRLGVLGPNLCPNGTFDNGATDWTALGGWVIGSGVVTATATSASFRQASAPLTAGKSYQVEFDYTHTSGTLYVRVGAGTDTTFTSSGRKSAVLKATTTAGVEFYGGAVTGVIDNITVRELTGNHATQSAVASKPSVQRVPKRLGQNLLTDGSFDDAAKWTAQTGWAVTGGNAVATAAASGANIQPAAGSYTTTETGKSYKAEVVITSITTGSVQLIIWNGSTNVASSAVITATGTYSFTYTATNTQCRPYLAAQSTGTMLTAASISHNEVLEWANVIRFDGSNDFLQTGITTGNEGFVAAGVTPIQVTTAATVFNAGATSDASKGVWLYLNAGHWVFRVGNGTARVDPGAVTASAGVPVVVSGGWTASTVMLDKDGATVSAARLGDCTSPTAAIVGAITGGTIPFAGSMSATVYCPVLPSAADRALIRRFVGSLQGQTL